MSLIEFAAARTAQANSKGARDGLRNKEFLADTIYAQQGACWICGEHLDDAQLDRLATGRALGICDCESECRHGYLPGNFGAAHRACHAPGNDSVRDRLTDAELTALAQRFTPTAEDVAQARAERRAARGRQESSEQDRRLAAARGRAQAA